MMVDTEIIRSVISAFGVRSWNATDTASSVSDRYSSTSNQITFLGKVIGLPIPSLRGAKRRSNPFRHVLRHGLLRFARNDDCLHCGSFLGEFQSHLAIAIRVVAPVLAHFHEQEQVHGLA